MKGGSSSSGPLPDPNALYGSKDKQGWTTLPAAGRQGPTPEWPLARPTKRELVLWEREWQRPQAVEWERRGQETEVAMYVRALVAAEKPSASVASRTLVRQQQEALGLSGPGLLRNRWLIGEVAMAEHRLAGQSSARSRLKVVKDVG